MQSLLPTRHAKAFRIRKTHVTLQQQIKPLKVLQSIPTEQPPPKKQVLHPSPKQGEVDLFSHQLAIQVS
jgi:hypothetical protein